MWNSLEHTSEGSLTSAYPSEKIFTLPEIKSEIYCRIYDTTVELIRRRWSDKLTEEAYTHALTSVIVSAYFWVVLDMKSDVSWISQIQKDPKRLEEYKKLIVTIRSLVGARMGDLSGVKSVRLIQDGDEEFRLALKGDPTNKLAKAGKSMTHMLRVEKKNGVIEMINLLDIYKLLTSPKSEQERKQLETAQKERKELQEVMKQEPLLGGSISYEYILWAGLATYGTVRTVQKIRYRNESWKMEEVVPSEKLEWTPDQIERTVSKTLAQEGINFDPVTGKGFRIFDRALESLARKLPTMSAGDYMAITGESVDVKRWDVIRQQLWEDFARKYKTVWTDIISVNTKMEGKEFRKNLAKWVWKKWVLVPIDILLASEVWAYANSATMISASSDLSAFYIGMKIAAPLGKTMRKLPVVGKYIGPLLESGGWAMAVGLWATIGKNIVWDHWLDGNVQKWQYLHTNSTWSLHSDGQSTTLHGLTGLWLPEIWDAANSKLQDTEAPPDIWVPRGSASVWKYHLFDIPEVNFFQGRIDYATDPGDWLRGGRTRTVDDWNRQIGGYPDKDGKYIEWHMHITAMRIIRGIIEKYQKWLYPFWEIIPKLTWNEDVRDIKIAKEKATLEREKILQIALNEALSGGNEPDKWFLDIKWLIVRKVISESKSWRWDQSYRDIWDVVKMQTSKLRIDEFFMTSYMPTLLAFHEHEIGELKKELYKHIKPEEHKFIDSILGKMVQGQPLFAPWKWEKTVVLWMSSNKWIESNEGRIYRELLENEKNPPSIQRIFTQVFWSTWPKEVSVSKLFSVLLNKFLEQKRRIEFLTEIQPKANGGKWNKSWVQWTL